MLPLAVIPDVARGLVSPHSSVPLTLDHALVLWMRRRPLRLPSSPANCKQEATSEDEEDEEWNSTGLLQPLVLEPAY